MLRFLFLLVTCEVPVTVRRMICRRSEGTLGSWRGMRRVPFLEWRGATMQSREENGHRVAKTVAMPSMCNNEVGGVAGRNV
jgi:hypothetical protein